MKDFSFIIISQSQKNCQTVRQSSQKSEGRSQQKHRQLGLFDPQDTGLLPQIKSQKPQISSTPGTSPKDLSRYRVTLAGKVLGDRLTADEAIQIAKRGES